MGLFDSIKNKPTAAAPTGAGNKTVEVVFSALPDTLEQFKALPQAAMRDPFDNPREVKLRLAKDGRWYLWEQMILVGIREPESANPWA